MTLPIAMWAGLLLSVVGNVWSLFLAYAVDKWRARLTTLVFPFWPAFWVVSKTPKQASVPLVITVCGGLLFLYGASQMLWP